MHSPTKLIIFDFDGTIANSIPLGFAIFQECAEMYNFRKMRDFTEYQELMTYSLPQILWKLRISPFKLKLIARQQLEIGTQKLLNCEIFPGIDTVIRAAAEKFQLALVSSNLHQVIFPFLDKYDLTTCFEYVVGSETSKDKKVKLKKVLEHFHVAPQQAVMIGDSVRDVRDAKELKIPIIAVTYGIHTKDHLVKESPRYLVHQPQEILPILESLSISSTR